MSLLLLFPSAAPSVVSLAASGTNTLTGTARLRSGIVTFGRTTENTSTLAPVAATLHGTRFTLGTPASFDTVYARLSNTGTGHQACAAKVALYSSSGGEPDELLGYSANVVIADNLALQWVEFELSSAVILNADDYFIAIWVSYDGDGVQLRYLNLQGKTYFRAYSSSGAPPDPFGAASEDFYMLELDIYALGEAVPEPLIAHGQQGLDGSADLTVVDGMVAHGTSGLRGSAWLTLREHGQDTFTAHGRNRQTGRARLFAYAVAAITSSSEAAVTTVTTSAPHGMPAGSSVPVTIAGHTSTPDLNGDHTATITGASTFTIPVEVTAAGSGGTASFPDASSGTSLPPTDDDGWTVPDATPSDLLGLKVTIAGLGIVPAQITDLTIDLDVEGGPKAASVGLNCALDRAPKLGTTTMVVTYKTKTLFRGRLENIVGDVSSTTGYDLTFAGPLITLRDHKAYRTVFVDSDLDNWRTDQGANSDVNGIFTTANDEGGLSVLVMQYDQGD